jgi:short-subunit dehydrogenase/threonine/homoserine/homoserine lactone efflux protein
MRLVDTQDTVTFLHALEKLWAKRPKDRARSCKVGMAYSDFVSERGHTGSLFASEGKRKPLPDARQPQRALRQAGRLLRERPQGPRPRRPAHRLQPHPRPEDGQIIGDRPRLSISDNRGLSPISTALKDNVVVITGASKGIGAELARQLAAKGAKLVLAARNERELEAVAEQCRKIGAAVVAVRADVAVERDCQSIMAGAAVAFGRIDVLVNNAGMTMWARFEDIEDLSILEQIMRVNYMGAVYCTRHALPHLRESAASSSASRASRAAWACRPHRILGEQARDDGLLRLVRIELADSGVGVTMIYPGFVATGIRENATGPDGKPILVSPVKEGEVMGVEDCVRRIVRAMECREREVVMTARGKIGLWLKLLARPWWTASRGAPSNRDADGPLGLDHLFHRDDRVSVSPGPGVFSSISSGLHHGFRLGLWNGVGMQMANFLMVIVVAFGLGTILLASETLFTAVKLGGRDLPRLPGHRDVARPRSAASRKTGTSTPAPPAEVFMRGLLGERDQPKGIILLRRDPAAVHRHRAPASCRSTPSSRHHVRRGLVVMMGYTALAAKVLRVMKDPAHLRWVNRTLGGAFVAAGVALASFRRAASAAAV